LQQHVILCGREVFYDLAKNDLTEEQTLKSFIKKHKRIAYTLLVLLIILAAGFLSINQYVKYVGSKYIYSAQDVPKADAVLVLGAYVLPSGNMSTMLKDRVMTGYELYETGKAPKIIVSGDHGRKNYDEVNTMKDFIKNEGVPGQDVFMDHAGFSTYESLYRARDIFQAKKVIIVTQRYHLMRAVFIARELGLEAYGVTSDLHNYGPVMVSYETREMAARNKDFWKAKYIKPRPTFLGDAIPVFGDGRATDDKQ
jgi:vancomycin permeability regulator SanA